MTSATSDNCFFKQLCEIGRKLWKNFFSSPVLHQHSMCVLHIVNLCVAWFSNHKVFVDLNLLSVCFFFHVQNWGGITFWKVLCHVNKHLCGFNPEKSFVHHWSRQGIECLLSGSSKTFTYENLQETQYKNTKFTNVKKMWFDIFWYFNL